MANDTTPAMHVPINTTLCRGTITVMTQWVREVNERNGWHDDARPISADIALLHSEVSEAYEAYRDGGLDATVEYRNPVTDNYAIVPKGDINDYTWRNQGIVGKPLGVASELADILIRLLDTADRLEVDLVEEFTNKMKYNATRGYKHGGKKE